MFYTSTQSANVVQLALQHF